MRLKQMLPIGLVLAPLCLFSTNALAVPSGPYVVGEAGGGFVSYSKLNGFANIDKAPALRQSMGPDLNERIAIGDYMQHLDSLTAVGIEMGYNYFNPLNSHSSEIIAGQRTLSTQTTKAWSTTVEGIASFDVFNDSTAFFTKLGIGYASIQRNITTTGTPISTTGTGNKSGIGVSGGMGFQFTLTQNLAFRVEADGLVGEEHVNYFQGLAGFVLGFKA